MWQVIGQPRAVELLKRSVQGEHLHHAYLFVGRPNVGKTTLAINFAQALNCDQQDRPCGRCRACRSIAGGNHPDVQLVRRQTTVSSPEAGQKKEISIEQIRDVQRAAGLKPYEGRYRVFIIEGAEHLNEASANCLLKTLEEPPSCVVFVLVADSAEGLLPTIVSRCQRIDLFPVSSPVIEKELVERHAVAPEKARLLSRLCNGGIGWAVSASAKEKLLEDHAARLDDIVGLCEADISERFAFANRLATQFTKSRDAVEDTLGLLTGWWRDILLAHQGCASAVTNVWRLDVLGRQAGEYTLAEIREAIGALGTASEQLAQNANARLVLETLMLRLPVSRRRERDEPYRAQVGQNG